MLQTEKPDDYVLSTNETHTVRDFVEKAFAVAGKQIKWSGEGVNEIATDQDGKVVVRIDPKYFRPTEVDLLLGDSTKAQKELGWKRKVTYEDLVKEMVEADLAACNDKYLKW